MGRSGDLLRQQKKMRTIYQFTAQQLQDHDDHLRAEWKKDIMDRVYAEAAQIDKKREEEMIRKVNEVWDRRNEEFKTGFPEEDFANYMRYLFSLPCRVLVEQFGWKPRLHSGAKKTKLQRFAEAMSAELNKICNDPNLGFIEYANQTDMLYGFHFEWALPPEEGEENGGKSLQNVG